MRVHVKKWGNSACLRIPAQVMAAAELHIDQAVEMRAEDGRIIVERAPLPNDTLDELLDRMNPKTFPEEIDFGPPAGQEIW